MSPAVDSFCVLTFRQNPCLELLIAIQNNDHDAFRQLYLRWHARSYYYFLNRCGSGDEARELVQLTFIKVWQSRMALKPDYPFETQLFNIASSVWIDRLRQQARHKNRLTVSRDELPEGATTHPGLDFEHNDYIEAALQQLPPMRRKVFELHRLRGYSYKEIAEMLTISVKTVDNHIAQAVKQLKTGVPGKNILRGQ